MSFSSIVFLFGLLLALLSPATAQTFTNCDPTKKSCPDDPAFGMNYTFDFSSTDVAKTWNTTNGVVQHGSNGGEFTINKRKDSPTIQSEFYIFFGVVEVHMKAAAGQGIISSIVLESNDRDEVDWEIIGGNNTHVESNYFGKGNDTTFDRALYHPVTTPLDLFHNYTVRWTADKIEWFIDTALVRTLPFKDALGGQNFPQTPMNVRLGIWAGGDPDLGNGTNEWAGGLTDFSKAPFTMMVQNVTVTDYSNGSAYHWSDNSGSWQSIKALS
jgi:beta-glucanase (GH16 family)